MSPPMVTKRLLGGLLVTGFTANFFAGVFINTFGAFLTPLTQDFHVARTAIVAAPMLFLAVLSIASPFVGLLLDRAPIRWVMAAGLLVTAGGLVMLSLSTALWQYLLTVALLVALPSQAAGMAAGMKLVSFFSKGRGLAMGVTALGISISGMVLPSVAMVLLDDYGWRVGYRLIALVFVVVLLPLVLAFTPAQAPKSGERAGLPSPLKALAACARTKAFWPIVLLVGVQSGLMATISVNLIELAASRGIERLSAAGLLSLVAAAAATGKVLWGLALDRWNQRTVILAALACQAAGLLALIPAQGLGPLALACAFLGLGTGAMVPMHSLLVGRLLGWRDFGAAYGATILATLPITLVVLFGGAQIYDRTGGYGLSLAILVGMIVIAAGAAIWIGPQDRPQVGQGDFTPVNTKGEA